VSTKKILLEEVIPWERYLHIDRFCSFNQGVQALPVIAAFLEDEGLARIELDRDIVEGYVSDSSNLPGDAAALARPKSVEECAALFRACFSARIPFTVSGGRSNLTGSATPEGGVIVSLDYLKEPPVGTDRDGMIVRSPAGIILEDMRNAVLQQSRNTLIFPVDPTSRADATVGGAVACNASGFTPGEEGAMRHWTIGLDVLLPNGLMVRSQRGSHVSEDGSFLLCHRGLETVLPIPGYVRPAIKNASGPFSSSDGVMDFIDLIVGSEGIFGIVTGCSLHLKQRPNDYLDIFFSLPGEDRAVEFLFYLKSLFSRDLSSLSALEYFGINCRKYMDYEQKFFREDHEVGIYIQVPLYEKVLEEAAEAWLDILTGSPCSIDGEAVRMMATDRDRALFLDARHSLPANSIEVVKRRGTHTILTDTVVPPEHFAEFLSYTNNLIASEGLDYLSFGHLGDCHLHFSIMPEKDELGKALDVYDRIVEKSAALGGVYSGEHGTGKRKKKDFLKCYGSPAADQVRDTKRVLDPLFLLNRGDVVDPL